MMTRFVERNRKFEDAVILPILTDPCVRNYYEEYYPTKLPELLRHRLTGYSNKILSDSTKEIMAFLELDARFAETLEDSTLLRLLDSFTIGGYRFSDITQIMADPDRFASTIWVAPEKRNVPSRALNELSLFMQFCFDLNHLLNRTSNSLLRSAIWNQYSYWFAIIGPGLRDDLGQALDRFAAWKPTSDSNGEATKAVQSYVSAARVVLGTRVSCWGR
jgi:hypothetical protein